MQLTSESYRVRWFVLILAWIFAALAQLPQASVVSEYFQITGELGKRGHQGPGPITPLNEIYPAFAADALVWVRHAVALTEGDDIRLRYTTIDNAPRGREVHWNSAWAWTIVGAGKVHSLFTGQPLRKSIEKATMWLNPLTLLALTIVLSAWVTRRGGVVLGVLVAVAMTCSDRFYEGFFPGYVDHHGLLTVTAFGLMLGGIFMGAGWWQANREGTKTLLPDSIEKARSAAVFSAICGACGLWVSAASAIPPVALVGIAGVAAIIIHGREAMRAGASFDGQTWRIWGRVGAAASFVFYLLEYFPQHMSMRMEPNHPLHALAWLGAGELIAQFGERWLGRSRERWSNLERLVWPAFATLAGPAVVIIGGAKVFSVLDPFMSRLHNDYIQEFLPLWRTVRGFDATAIVQVIGLGSLPIIAAVATLSYERKKASIVLWFATVAAGMFILMAILQSRWLLNSSGIQVALVMVVVSAWTINRSLLVRSLAVLVAVCVLYVPTNAIRFINAHKQVKKREVSPKDAAACVNRDIARLIRESQPEGDITLLASPNASTGIAYYGRFKTLGTLYWENTEGLKAAALVHSAKSEDEAAKLIKHHGITHIALVFEENFIEQYHRLIYPKAPPEEVKQTFAYRLLQEKVVPQWLQMIPYKVPDDLTDLKPVVMLFKVNFNQTMPEALYNVARTQIAGGAVLEGEKTIDRITGEWPQFYEPWLLKGELLAGRAAWKEAAQAMLNGIGRAPANLKAGLFANAAGTLYNNQQHTLAVEVYRFALNTSPTTDLSSYLAWILATSKDDALRHGQEAHKIAEEIVKAQPTSPAYLSVMSAALAELGRMPEAVAAAEQAVATARLRQDPSAEILAQRLETLKSGQPLRY